MSYGEDDELDWGEEDYKHLGDADAVDVVSLGDEEEIQVVDFPTEGVVEVPAPASAVQTPREPPTSPNKTRLGLASQSSLGLSHLPPKPRTVVAGGRSRETIKAAAMARPHARSRSPPGADLPHNWEIRRSDLTVYYYHTVLCASQLKRPTREDARLDSKSCWKGEAPPPSPLVRSQSARNAPSVRTVRLRIRATARPHCFSSFYPLWACYSHRAAPRGRNIRHPPAVKNLPTEPRRRHEQGPLPPAAQVHQISRLVEDGRTLHNIRRPAV